MNIDGGDQRQLSNGARGEQNPQFSPDGRWIVYRTALGKPVVWKIPADGGEPVQLTDKISLAPTISPEGKWIAYTYSDGSKLGIEIVPLEGGEPIKTFVVPRTLVRPLRWTPDGRAIAYIDSADGLSNIVAQPLDGGNPLPLTEFKVDQIFSFAFSADGKQLALSRGTVESDVVLIKDFR